MKDNTAWMVVYSTKHRPKHSYVSADGNYGSDEVLVFPYDTLTEQQWEQLNQMHESNRLPYVEAIISGEDYQQYEDDTL
jgi:hypothetical protein